jgi:hypothetical protein
MLMWLVEERETGRLLFFFEKGSDLSGKGLRHRSGSTIVSSRKHFCDCVLCTYPVGNVRVLYVGDSMKSWCSEGHWDIQ